MQLKELLSFLQSHYEQALEVSGNQIWRISAPPQEVIVRLSEDQTWVRVMIPIASASEAQPFLADLLELNYEVTAFIKYAIANQVLWAVFNHPLNTLTKQDATLALHSLETLHRQGLSHCFEIHADRQVRLIILASKRQGLSLEATLQNLERFYREGIIGDLSDSDQTIQMTLKRWRNRLERLWPEVNIKEPSTS